MLLGNTKEKETDIDFLINQKIHENRLSDVLFIVPTNRKSRHLKKELINVSPGKYVSDLHIETIGTFSEKLYSLKNDYQEISESVSAVLINQCFTEIDLKYFNSYKGNVPPGTVARISNLISKYKKNGVQPSEILTYSEKIEDSEKNKALDIYNIYKLYTSKCQKLNILDTGDIYRVLCENPGIINKLFCESFRNVCLIVVYGFDEFTLPEIEILTSVGSDDLRIYIDFDYYQYNNMIFGHLDECKSRFLMKGFNIITDLRQVPENPYLTVYRRKLFKLELKNNVVNSDKFYKIISNDRNEEIRIIASKIKELIIDQNVEPHKIALVFNVLPNYSSLVETIFTDFGIPVNITERITLDRCNPVIAIMNLLSVLQGDYYYKNIIRAFSNGFITIDGLDLNSLTYVAVNYRITGGRQNWYDTLNANLASVSGEENRDKKTLNKALESIRRIDWLLSPFCGKIKPDQFFAELKKLANNLDFLKKMMMSEDKNKEKNIKSLSTFFETIYEIIELIKLEKGQESGFDINFYLNNIFPALKRARFNIKEKSDYGVLVTSVNEIRGLSFDYLFVGGMVDGDFPTSYSPELFSMETFNYLEKKHQVEDRYHFYQTLCCFRKKIFFSVPARDVGRDLEKSVLLEDLEKIIHLETIENHKTQDYLYSEEDIFIRLDPDQLLAYLSEIGFNKLDCFEDILSRIRIDQARIYDSINAQGYNGCHKLELENIRQTFSEFAEREYSVTQLETYAKCPHKYYLERILKIDSVKNPAEEIDALEYGNILHSILYEFYNELKSRNLHLQACSDDVFAIILDVLKKIMSAYSDIESLNLPLSVFEKEKLFGIDNQFETSLLYKFLELERNSGEIVPVFFEKEFNFSENQNYEINGVRLKGKIDRIEINQQEKEYNVIDYKSGKKPSKKDLIKGFSLQLPVYLYLTKELLNENGYVNYSPGKMIIYSLKYNHKIFGKSELKIPSFDGEDPVVLLFTNTEKKLREIVNNIMSGKFNVTSDEDIKNTYCQWCSFKFVCRITEKKCADTGEPEFC